MDRLLRTAATADGLTSRTKAGQASPIAAAANALKGKVNGHRKEAVMELVRQTLRHNRGFFTARTLVQFINRTKPFSVTEPGIRNLLCRLLKLGEIRLAEKGNGRKPHMYLKF